MEGGWSAVQILNVSMKCVTRGDVLWLLDASKGGELLAFMVKCRLHGVACKNYTDLVPLLPPATPFLALFPLVQPDRM